MLFECIRCVLFTDLHGDAIFISTKSASHLIEMNRDVDQIFIFRQILVVQDPFMNLDF